MAASEGLTDFSAASSISLTSTAATNTVYYLDTGGVAYLCQLISDACATKAEAKAGVIPGGKIWIE